MGRGLRFPTGIVSISGWRREFRFHCVEPSWGSYDHTAAFHVVSLPQTRRGGRADPDVPPAAAQFGRTAKIARGRLCRRGSSGRGEKRKGKERKKKRRKGQKKKKDFPFRKIFIPLFILVQIRKFTYFAS